MRPIKFRAWDGELRKMCHMIYVGAEGWHGEYWENGAMVSCFSDQNHKDNALMQFTGLLDKNGKEIWEGDVVINRNNNWAENLKKPCIVEYEEGGFNPFVGDDRAWKTKYVEVLGNVWENPELLKA